MKLKDKLLVAFAYFIGIPAIYIVLTPNKYRRYMGWHGQQAFYLWLLFFIILFTWRFLVNLFLSVYFLPSITVMETIFGLFFMVYAVFCGVRAFLGKEFTIPH